MVHHRSENILLWSTKLCGWWSQSQAGREGCIASQLTTTGYKVATSRTHARTRERDGD
uniref:Uncharacterized protein n=1 Tax=Oryza sativa subsp. japonica TaxID=39947 RepID=Q8LHQ2_ORYSJ|nr:hypothetical protein [Oryza sativa Japonica Group]